MDAVKKNERIPRVLIFGGTTESLRVLDFLEGFDLYVVLSVATEYGRECAGKHGRLQVICGRMDREEILSYIKENFIHLVIDATHPFALEITANIRWACKEAQTEYMRCLREELEAAEEMPVQIVRVSSVDEAGEDLSVTEGNILITTGSKELRKFCRIPDYKTRCFARVLSVPESVQSSVECGFTGRNLIAMRPPFSKEMNVATIHYADAVFFVTKETGDAGGMKEKIQACLETGTTLVVIRRPREAGGLVEEICDELDKKFLKYRLTV